MAKKSDTNSTEEIHNTDNTNATGTTAEHTPADARTGEATGASSNSTSATTPAQKDSRLRSVGIPLAAAGLALLVGFGGGMAVSTAIADDRGGPSAEIQAPFGSDEGGADREGTGPGPRDHGHGPGPGKGGEQQHGPDTQDQERPGDSDDSPELPEESEQSDAAPDGTRQEADAPRN